MILTIHWYLTTWVICPILLLLAVFIFRQWRVHKFYTSQPSYYKSTFYPIVGGMGDAAIDEKNGRYPFVNLKEHRLNDKSYKAQLLLFGTYGITILSDYKVFEEFVPMVGKQFDR